MFDDCLEFFFIVWHDPKPQHVPFLVIEPTRQIAHRQLGAKFHAQAINSKDTDICVVVLCILAYTLRHMWAIYLLCTIAARIPLKLFRYDDYFIPTSAKQMPTSTSSYSYFAVRKGLRERSFPEGLLSRYRRQLKGGEIALEMIWVRQHSLRKEAVQPWWSWQ